MTGSPPRTDNAPDQSPPDHANVVVHPPLYPAWQAYYRTRQPPTLVVRGRNDTIFPAGGAGPYKGGLKTIEFHLLDIGHVALKEDGEKIARPIRRFLKARIP